MRVWVESGKLDSAIARPKVIAPYLNLAFKPLVPDDGTQHGHY